MRGVFGWMSLFSLRFGLSMTGSPAPAVSLNVHTPCQPTRPMPLASQPLQNLPATDSLSFPLSLSQPCAIVCSVGTHCRKYKLGGKKKKRAHMLSTSRLNITETVPLVWGKPLKPRPQNQERKKKIFQQPCDHLLAQPTSGWRSRPRMCLRRTWERSRNICLRP